MIATIVHVYVRREFIEQFIAATKINHENSINEPENLRFDILQDASNPAKFTLYEAYRSEEGVTAHKDTAHYKLWRDTVAEWMAEPRQGVKHKMLFPNK
jgi:(4S)-4-hydroxy-5-phosphonooxypentane-2,3-dione isomerase